MELTFTITDSATGITAKRDYSKHAIQDRTFPGMGDLILTDLLNALEEAKNPDKVVILDAADCTAEKAFGKP